MPPMAKEASPCARPLARRDIGADNRLQVGATAGRIAEAHACDHDISRLAMSEKSAAMLENHLIMGRRERHHYLIMHAVSDADIPS